MTIPLLFTQGLFKIGDYVVRVFESDGQTHQPIRNSRRCTLLRRDIAVRHRNRVSDQRFGGAEGIPPLYAITREILCSILAPAEAETGAAARARA